MVYNTSYLSFPTATMVAFSMASLVGVNGFVSRPTGWGTTTTTSNHDILKLQAAPKRLEENVEGVVYVNQKCINCAACSNFAPTVFQRSTKDYAHIVHHQPSTPEQILDARAAMAACPVAAIRSETLAQRRHRSTNKAAVEESWTQQDEHLVQQMALSPKVNGLDLPFPRPLLYHDATNNNNEAVATAEAAVSNVYNVGHHNERSFGATPYLMEAKINGREGVWVMVDTPKFNKNSLEAVTSITGEDGPEYLFLTHVDDTADHDKWAEQFPSLKRIFHQGDTGKHNWLRDTKLDNEVEILLQQPNDDVAPPFLTAYSMLDGKRLPNDWLDDFVKDEMNDVVILHTPGHSPGSITLWKKATTTADSNEQPGIIFTGDHYAYTTRDGGRMSGFPRYNKDGLSTQAKSLQHLLKIDWDIVAPGHGHPRDYSNEPSKEQVKREEMEQAIMDLHK